MPPALLILGAIAAWSWMKGRNPTDKVKDLSGDRAATTPSIPNTVSDPRTVSREQPGDRGPGNTGNAYRTNVMPPIRGMEITMPNVISRPNVATPVFKVAEEGTPTSRLHPVVERNILTIQAHTVPVLVTDTGVGVMASEPRAVAPDERNRVIFTEG